MALLSFLGASAPLLSESFVSSGTVTVLESCGKCCTVFELICIVCACVCVCARHHVFIGIVDWQ